MVSLWKVKTRAFSETKNSAFLAAISRGDIDVNNMDKYRICSRHLVSNKPAKTLDETNIDWIPTLHLGHAEHQQTTRTAQLERSDRSKKEVKNNRR